MVPLEQTREELVSSLTLQTPGPQPLSLQTLDTISEVAGAPPTPRESGAVPTALLALRGQCGSQGMQGFRLHTLCPGAPSCQPSITRVWARKHLEGPWGHSAALIVLSLGLAAQPGSPQMTTPRHRCSMAQSP